MIGLQALAAYASLIYSDGIKASVQISEKTSNTQVASFEINDGNSFVEFTKRLPRVTDIQLKATGRGCFLMQVGPRISYVVEMTCAK